MKATNFNLPDQERKMHSLDDYKGRWLVMYFYPRDNTPGCTLEAQGFQRLQSEFEKLRVQVLGVSTDSASSHRKFAQSQRLNFPLLCDEKHELISSFGAWEVKKFMGRKFEGTRRQTVIINPEGELVKKYENVKPALHPREVLEDIKKLIA